MRSEEDVGGVAAADDLPTSIPSHFVTEQQMAEGGSLTKITSDVEVHVKQRCVIKFLHAEKKQAY